MATSTNYGWAEPDNSSLVKNGASDIRTLGNAIDASVWSVGFGQAGKNKIINGDFNINQRAFTTASTDGVYTYDRWVTSLGSSGGTCTFTPQTFTAGAAPVAGYESKNFYQLVTASQSGASDWAAIYQKIEDVRTFAGQTLTFSFWAKASSGTPNVGVTIGQQFGSGGSSTVINSPAVKAITTSWARYSFTVNVASISGKTIGANSHVQAYIFVSDGSTLTALGYAATGLQNNTFQIWGVQVEYGSTATPFQTASGGSLQGELAMCQRYYEKSYDIATAPATNTTIGLYSIGGSSDGSGYQRIPIKFAVAKRNASYSVAVYQAGGTSGSWATIRLAGSSTGAVAAEYQSTNNMELYIQTSVVWLVTLGQGHWVVDNEL